MKKQLVSLILSFGLALCASGGLAGDTNTATAVIDGKTADRVHLRAEPSPKARSLGLYFTGTEVLYDSGSNGEWTSVVIGDQAGFIKSEYLYFGNNPSSIKSQQPSGIVTNVKVNSWVNFRSGPHQNSASIGTLYKGDIVTVLGETVTEWYYVKSNDLYGYIAADFLQVGALGTNTGGNSGSNQNGSSVNSSKLITITADPKDSVQAYVTIKNCTLNIVPTDGRMVECTYDTSVLRFEQSIARGVHMLTVESISGKRIGDNATAMLRIPRALYNAVFADVRNGEASIAGGIESHMDISGTDARVSVYYPADNTYSYLMRFTNSTCVFGISESASDYAISIQRVKDSSITVPNGMPSNIGNGSDVGYEYVRGNGSTQITVDALDNSVLEFAFVR